MKLIKKLIIASIVCVTTMLSMTGCSSWINISSEPYDEELGLYVDFKSLEFVSIGENLYYDKNTNIVYIWNGVLNACDYSTVPCPYYAPNGLPYKYNPETKSLEEIGGN